jgi:Rrf2 family transcriptional regulator, iron-sulfur cluster assembly transcription factor
MISQTVKYALRILGHLADHPGEWIQGEQIAGATRIPANYLSKILNQLRKRGVVSSQKGWGGGFLIEEKAMEIPIAEVVELFDGKRMQDACVFGLGQCDAEDPCPLHHHWEAISKNYEAMLDAVTIRDLHTVTSRKRLAPAPLPRARKPRNIKKAPAKKRQARA